MIALDTSAFVRYIEGMVDRATAAATVALASDEAVLPPVVLTEMLSNPTVAPTTVLFVSSIPLLDLHDGYWHRAASLRAEVLRRGFKAELPDCLIAQSCIDHDIPLITYDLDFRHFVHAGLKLL